MCIFRYIYIKAQTLLCFCCDFVFCLSCRDPVPDWFKILVFLVFIGPSFLFLGRLPEAGGLQGQPLDKWSNSLSGGRRGRRIKEWKDICCDQTGQRPHHLDKPNPFWDQRPLEDIQSFSACIKTADWEAHLMLVHRICSITNTSTQTHTHTPQRAFRKQ